MNFENGLPFWFRICEGRWTVGGYSSLAILFIFFMSALLGAVSIGMGER